MLTVQAQWPVTSVLRPQTLPWPLAHEPGNGPLLRQMLAAVNIDEYSVSAPVMDGLMRTCAGCPRKTFCAHELGTGRAACSFTDYCPNADILLGLR